MASERDISTAIKLSVLNTVLGALASQRSDDLIVVFPPTRPLLEERKSVLGIRYTNRLDIDTGTVRLNLRRASIVSQRSDALNIALELEGEGKIAVSGRYTGIPASSQPRVELVLRDTIAFRLRAGTRPGTIALYPQRRSVFLTATLHVSLLGWEIPWEERIPLQVEELISPVEIPALISTSIRIPMPARSFSDTRYEFVDTPVSLSNTGTLITPDAIRFDADVTFR
ncbi:MAG: hypothetical protein C0600_01380 [Ignavibacteria bacterium]|nr:MAG: hypothetical protein C0600_01380 [Ignavibacteria bacterium]